MARERAGHEQREEESEPGEAPRHRPLGRMGMAGNRALAAAVQRRLVVGPASDPAEAEADVVARQVVDAIAQRSSAGGAEGGVVEPHVASAIDGARSGGKPLAADVAADFGAAFGGVDFGAVRVHDDAHADALNRSMSAEAFTTGADVFFSKGAYRPDTEAGRLVLAHELTHVVQQGEAGQPESP